MKKHVTSLELSKKLKELGVKQESEFYWVKNIQGITELYFNGNPTSAPIYVIYPDAISAFLSSELGEMLPYLVEGKDKNFFYETGKCEKNNRYCREHEVGYSREGYDVLYSITDNTEANARAKMLIYLIENNLI